MHRHERAWPRNPKSVDMAEAKYMKTDVTEDEPVGGHITKGCKQEAGNSLYFLSSAQPFLYQI